MIEHTVIKILTDILPKYLVLNVVLIVFIIHVILRDSNFLTEKQTFYQRIRRESLNESVVRKENLNS